MRRQDLSKDAFEILYFQEKLTLVQIAERTGVPRTTLSRWMKEWGLSTIERGPVKVGTRFGRLVVIEEHRSGKHGVPTSCLCQCVCGRKVDVAWGNLQQGVVISCGCYRSESLRRPDGMAVRQAILHNDYHRIAKMKKLEWALTDSQAFSLFQGSCHYCGILPYRIRTMKQNRVLGEYTYNGIDRVDSLLGYTEGNVVSCCPVCNLAKGKTEKSAFIRQVLSVRQGFLSDPIRSFSNDKETGWAYARYRARAFSRGLAFSLTREDVQTLISRPCFYCGSKGHLYPAQSIPDGILRNGIDRKDSGLGYTVENCVPCCPVCNQLKGTRSVEEFMKWAWRFQAHQASQKENSTK